MRQIELLVTAIFFVLIASCEENKEPKHGTHPDNGHASREKLPLATEGLTDKEKARLKDIEDRITRLQNNYKKSVSYGADSVYEDEHQNKIILRGRAWFQAGSKLYNGVQDEDSEIILNKKTLELISHKGAIEISTILK